MSEQTNCKEFKGLYLYAIKCKHKEGNYIYDFMEIKGKFDFPLYFEDKKGVPFIILHGNENGYLGLEEHSENQFSLRDIESMYSSLSYRKKQKINIICCFGKLVQEENEKSKFLRIAIKSKDEILIRIAMNDELQILTKDKIKIPKSLKKSLKYKGVYNGD